MPSIYDFGIQMANPSAAFENGFNRGEAKRKQNGLAQLAGDYAAGGAPNYQGIAANGGDPMAFRKDAQGQQDRQREQVGQFAALLVNAPPQMRPSIYAKIQPQLAAMGLEAPPEYSPEIDGMAQQIAQQFGGSQAQPETFSNAGQGFMLGNRGTTRQIPGYAEAAGALTGAQAQARGQAAAEWRAPAAAPKPAPVNAMQQRRQTLETEIFPGLEQEMGAAFTPAMRQQVAAQYLGTGQFRIADPAGSPGGAQNRKQSQAERVKLAQLDTVQRQIDRLDKAAQSVAGNAVFDGGPLDQYAIKYTPQGQELEQSAAAILPVLTALTRVPGVGAQSDLESRLATLQLPSAGLAPEVNKAAVAALREYMADLKAAYQSIGGQSQAPASGQQPAPANNGWSIKAVD